MAELGDWLCGNGPKSTREVTHDMMEYGYVEKCEKVEELRSILIELKSGHHGRYPHLENTVEAKLLSKLPAKQRELAATMKRRPTGTETAVAAEALREWEAAMKTKESRLKEDVQMETNDKPVRGRLHVETVAEKPKKDEVSKKKAEARLSGYDWRAWEKFDVDQACAQVDDEAKAPKAEPKLEEKRRTTRVQKLSQLRLDLDVEAKSLVERTLLANREKNKGNDEYRAGDLDEAYHCFSKSVAYLETAVGYANRALACVKLGLLEAAEDDCTTAIRLDPSYVKAVARRGITRLRRGKYKDAITDFDNAIKLEPNAKNVSALTKLKDEALVKLSSSSGAFTRVNVIDCDDDDDDVPTSVRVPIVADDDEE